MYLSKFHWIVLFIMISTFKFGVKAFGEEPTLSPTPRAEWTFLVFLNGNNNLDSFGTMNLKQMEKVGSTPDVNVVVQWASLQNGDTRRLLIQKDTSHTEITSPVVENLGKVDMGSSHSLLDFIHWATQKYPAKHYVIDVWNHGSGWHSNYRNQILFKSKYHVSDISWDDNTGHAITTQELATVLRATQKLIGHKIDLYGSDACLMGMTEIASEVADAVDTYVGSEEVEAAAGWPYDKILAHLITHPQITSQELGKIMTSEYIAFYTSPENQSNATFSAFDLSKIHGVNQAIRRLGLELLNLQKGDRSKLLEAVGNAQRFTYEDYADLTDVLTEIESLNLPTIQKTSIRDLRGALAQMIIAYGSTAAIPKAYGAAIWFPTSAPTFNHYTHQYQSLNFEAQTQWNEVLKFFLGGSTF